MPLLLPLRTIPCGVIVVQLAQDLVKRFAGNRERCAVQIVGGIYGLIRCVPEFAIVPTKASGNVCRAFLLRLFGRVFPFAFGLGLVGIWFVVQPEGSCCPICGAVERPAITSVRQ